MGGRLPQALAARQDRALDPRHQLHRLVQLEDLRQGRRRHLGDAADGLPAHAPRHAQPRAARLLARRVVLLVPVQREPRQVPDGARRAGARLARGTQAPRRGRGVAVDRRRPGAGEGLQVDPWPGRLRALDVGRGAGDHRRSQRPHDQALRARPGGRLLADPGDVDGLVRRGQPLPVADRRRLHELLRLVLRPAAGLAADLGRADRRPGVGRLVQLDVHHRLGQQRAADAHARRALLHRGPLQGREDRRGHARLRRGLQARRPVAAPEAGHRRRARDGDGPRDPQGVPRRPAVVVLRRLLPPLHRHADAGEARQARRSLRGGPLPADLGARRPAGRGQQPRVEDRRRRRAFRQAGGAARHDRLSLGPEGGRRPRQVEPRDARRARRGGEARAVAARPARRGRAGGVPVLRRHRGAALHRERPGRRHPAAQRSREARAARRRRGVRRDRLRPGARQLRRRPRTRRRRGQVASTTTSPIRRSGRRRSPASRRRT